MKIGKVNKIDLRDVWKHEAKNFTQWLAENMDHLSDALNIGIETLDTEVKIDESKYTIDILAQDTHGNSIIIENQLEKTDHTHLGQIITYATNHDARTVIWIAKEPRQEHINAINWLNEFSDKKFYLVEVEAYKIDNSAPAPFFSVICKPSLESKMIGKANKQIEIEKEIRIRRVENCDTIIVPARLEGFEKVFLGENRWYSIPIKAERIEQIKYIAGYQVSPESAITYIAEVDKIIPSFENSDKYEVKFKCKAKKIKPIPLGSVLKIQGPSYCEYDKLLKAKNIDELFGSNEEEKKAA